MYISQDHILDIMQFSFKRCHDGMMLFVAQDDGLPVADDS